MRLVHVLALGVHCWFTAILAASQNIPAVPRIDVAQADLSALPWLLVGPTPPRLHSPDGAGSVWATVEHSHNETELRAGLERAMVSSTPATALRAVLHAPSAHSPLDLVKEFSLHYSPPLPEASAYAVCILHIDSPAAIYLLLGSDDCDTVWLDGTKVGQSEVTTGRPLHEYDELHRLQLHKGDNVLLLRIDNLGGAWAFSGVARRLEREATATALAASGTFLANEVIHSPENLRLRLRGGPAPCEAVVEVTGREKVSTKLSSNAPPTTPPGPNGIYQLRLEFDGSSYFEDLCIGEPDEIAEALHRAINPASLSDRDRQYVEVLRKRIRFLVRAKEEMHGNLNWQRSILHTLSLLRDCQIRAALNEDLHRNVRGLHYGVTKSPIDGQTETYRIAVPDQPNGMRPLPLVVVLPPVIEEPRAFMEGPLVYDILTAERLARAVTSQGAAILWVGYRCNPYGHAIEFSHFADVLDAVQHDYAIDPSRVYLLGACSSGITAGMLALRWPERFAGIGMVNPVLHRLTDRNDGWISGATLQKFRNEMGALDPVAPLARLPGMAIEIVQNGDDPAHGPAWEARDLLRRVHRYGNVARLELNEEITEYADSIETVWADRLIPWLLQQSRVSASNLPDPQRIKAMSVEEVVATPFVVVRGTGGTPAQVHAVARIVSKICADWLNSQYGDCVVKDDVDLVPADEETKNLILVGSASTNRLWRKLEHQLPISARPQGLTVGGHSWSAQNLSFQVVVANPQHPARKVLLVGANNLENANYGTLDFAMSGWYSYAVWDSSSSEPLLITADYSVSY